MFMQGKLDVELQQMPQVKARKTHVVSQADRVLIVLSDGNWHSGLEFTRLERPILCYTKRISELRMAGHNIRTERKRRLVMYRLERI